MLATQTPVSAAPSRLSGTASSDLQFRIQGGEHHGRILRIAAAKCSIGSAPGCTLRLRREDIEPLHCLIVSGPNGTIVRRNSPRTYLNGGPFEDAALQAGDMLRVGSIELQVVACPQAVSSARPALVSEPADAGNSQQEQQRLMTELAAMEKQLLVTREQLEQARQHSAEQCEEHTRAVTQLREQNRRELEGLLSQQREEQANSVSQAEHLQAEQAAVAAERQQLEGKLAALESEVNQQQQQLAEHQRERDEANAVRSQLENSVSTLTEQLRRRDAEPAPAQPRGSESIGKMVVALEQARGELRDLQLQRSQDEDVRKAMRVRMEEQFADLTARLVEREKELAHRDDELTGLRQRVSQFSAADQVIQQLEESLAASALAQQAEREAWQRERQSLECQRSELEAARRELQSQAAPAQEAAQYVAQVQTGQQHDEQVERWQSEAHKWQLQAKEFAGQLSEGKLLCARLESELTELKGAVPVADAGASPRQNIEDLSAQIELLHQELARRDQELAELRQSATRFSATDQVIEQLEESLAAAALAQQAERETWQRERQSLECQRSELETARRELESQAALAQEAAQNAAKDQAGQQHEVQVERWQSEAHKWQLQAEEFAGQLGEGKLLCGKLESELVQLKGAVQVADAGASPRQNIEDLHAQIELLHQELAQTRADLLEEKTQLGRLLGEASSREEGLTQREAELQEREAAWDAARGERESLEERSKLLDSQVAQFEAEQVGFARQQAAIIKQMSALEDRVHELTKASESRNANSPGMIQRKDHLSQRGELEPIPQPQLGEVSARDAEGVRPEGFQSPELPPAWFVDEVEPPVPTAGAALEEVDSVVNRLAQAGLRKMDESLTQESAEAPRPDLAPEPFKYTPPSFLAQAAEMARQEELAGMPNQPGAEFPLTALDTAEQPSGEFPFAADGSGENEDSIEQYMSRLLNRMRGGASPPAITADVPEDQAALDTPEEEITPDVASENSSQRKEYVPRASVPVQPERLSLMRELANSAAQSAIHTHARQHQQRDTRRKSLVALLMLIGAISLAIVTSVTASPIAIVGAACFIAICCVMSLRAVLGGFRQLRLVRPKEIGEAQEAAANTQNSE